MNFDAHTNVGIFPTSKSSDRIHQATIDEMVEHIKVNNLQAHICLYPRDGYWLMEALRDRLPTVRHIGVQVVMGIDAQNATDVKKVTFDVNDIARSWRYGGLSYGIKLASHRGWWNRDGVVDSGLNYGDSRFVGGMLKQMPDNALVSFHMQGEPSYGSCHHPTMISMYASKYPRLKFIANHCGDYGQAMLSNRPVSYQDARRPKGGEFVPPFRHAHSRALIASTIMYANDLHNLMIDSSIFTPYKALALMKCKRFLIGSDFPFQKKIEKFYLMERRKFELNGHPLDEIFARNKAIMDWIDRDWEINLSAHEAEYDARFIPERKKQRDNVASSTQIYW